MGTRTRGASGIGGETLHGTGAKSSARLLGARRVSSRAGGDHLLRRPFEAVRQESRQVQEHLRRDPRISPLHALEEPLVDGQHLDLALRDDVGGALRAPYEAHLAKDVATLELQYLPARAALPSPHLARALEDHIHLLARIPRAYDHLAIVELLHLAHEHDDPCLRRPQAREERNRPRGILAELH